MLYAIISDVHANEVALSRVIEDARSQGAQNFICLGDVVGYGPLPAESLKLLNSINAVCIAGNHDDAVSGRMNAADFIDLAHDAVNRHREALSEEQLQYLRSLPYVCQLGEAIATHGDLIEPKNFNYIDNQEAAIENFNSTTKPLIFAGHTHVPSIYLIGSSGTVYSLPPQDFTMEEGKRYIVNPGSVGYPREKDGQCFSSYVIYDSEERTISFRFIPFSVSSVMQRGSNPKKINKPLLITLIVLISLFAALSAWYFAPKKVISEIHNTNTTESLTLESKTIYLSKDSKFINVCLYLDKKESPDPAKFEILYYSENDELIDKDSDIVKLQRDSFKPIPVAALKRATKATITISKQKKDDKVKIKKFEPSFSATK